MKKIIIIAILSIFFLTGVISYFYLKNYKEYNNNELLKAVPTNSSVFLEINDFEKFVKNIRINGVFNTFSLLFDSNNNDLDFIDSVFSNNDDVSDFMENKKVIVAANMLGGGTWETILISNVKSSREENDIKQSIIDISTKNGAKILQRKYENTNIYEIKSSKNSFYIAFAQGIMLFSKTPVLIEESIRQIKNKYGLLNDVNFKNISKIAGKDAQINLFVNYDKFQSFLSIFADSSIKNKLQDINLFANWTALDIQLKEKTMFLNGFTSINEEESNYLSIFNGQSPVKCKLQKIFPNNTSSFFVFGISDYVKFSDDYKKYLTKINEIDKHKENINKIKKEQEFDAEDFFANTLNKEVAIININSNDTALFAMKIKDRQDAEEKLIKIIKSSDKNNKTTIFKGQENNYSIYYLPINNLPQIIFGDIFKMAITKYFTFIDDNIVFANRSDMLKDFIQKYEASNNFGKNVPYNKFAENISDEVNLFFYINPSIDTSKYFINNYLADKYKNLFSKNIKHLNNIEGFAMQISCEKSMFYTTAFVKVKQNNKIKLQQKENQEDTKQDTDKKTSYLWKTQLEANSIIKPQIVINYKTKEKEIFIQDENNTVYLIDNKGNILWKKKIDGKILGNITQIDALQNGKLQMLFNTTQNIHLIDVKGDNVPNFPIKTASQITAPISVFDYDKKRNYRIFAACKDNKVYVYSQKGQKIDGWKFGGTKTNITTQIKYFKIENNDCIVFADSKEFFITNRVGKLLVKNPIPILKSANSEIFFDKINKKFITTNNQGTIYLIDLKGNVEKIAIKIFSNLHNFIFADIDGDSKDDYIFIDGKSVSAFKTNKQKIFEILFKLNIANNIQVIDFQSNNKKIAAAEYNGNNSFIINYKGQIDTTFFFNKPFNIYKIDDKIANLQLIHTDNNKFLYSYKLKIKN